MTYTAVEQANIERVTQKWISIDKEQPPLSPGPLSARESDWVWVLDTYGSQYRALRCIDGLGNEVYEAKITNYIQHVAAKHITHWMSLPQLPEEKP